jgi:hypothetical protein
METRRRDLEKHNNLTHLGNDPQFEKLDERVSAPLCYPEFMHNVLDMSGDGELCVKYRRGRQPPLRLRLNFFVSPSHPRSSQSWVSVCLNLRRTHTCRVLCCSIRMLLILNNKPLDSSMVLAKTAISCWHLNRPRIPMIP